MLMLRNLAIFLALLTGSNAFGQSLVPKFTDAVKLKEAINTESEESQPLYDAQNQKLYFVRTFDKQNTGGKLAGQDIWMASGEKENWKTAVNTFPKLNNENNNAVVGVSADGKRLYLLNQYAGKNNMKFGLSLQKADTLVPEPVSIPGLASESKFYGFFVNAAENVILMSVQMEGGVGEEDLYVSLKDANGNWSAPKNLGTMINSSGFEISPFLDADGKTLYFSSSGKGGLGSADILVSQRLDDSWTKWTIPQNLGRKVNSNGFDAYFSKYDDRAFFCSNKGTELSDIYTIRIMSKEELMALLPPRKEIYFALNAYMINNESKKVLEEVVQTLNDKMDLKIEISGYTCNLGDEARNRKLSENRAKAVNDYLQIMGINSDRIVVNAYGEFDADKAQQDEETQRKFRKVELKYLYMDM